MAYTSIERSFWTDPYIKKLTLKERYFYLYLMTNHHAHYSGVFYLPYIYMIEESNLNRKEIVQSLKKLNDKIQYDNDTEVIFIINMFKYQYGKGGNPKVIFSGIEKHFQNLHSVVSIKAFISKYQGVYSTLRQGWFKVASTLRQGYGTDTDIVTETDVETDTDSGTENDLKIPYKEIIDYLNLKLNSKYRDSSKETRKLIKARCDQGFTFEDFKTVIDKKEATWGSDATMSAYLRPETLFGNKFEGYLNEKEATNKFSNFDEWERKHKAGDYDR